MHACIMHMTNRQGNGRKRDQWFPFEWDHEHRLRSIPWFVELQGHFQDRMCPDCFLRWLVSEGGIVTGYLSPHQMTSCQWMHQDCLAFSCTHHDTSFSWQFQFAVPVSRSPAVLFRAWRFVFVMTAEIVDLPQGWIAVHHWSSCLWAPRSVYLQSVKKLRSNYTG